jgi:hypothetical protein
MIDFKKSCQSCTKIVNISYLVYIFYWEIIIVQLLTQLLLLGFDRCTAGCAQPTHMGGTHPLRWDPLMLVVVHQAFPFVIWNLILALHHHNNSSHEGGPQCVVLTLMWGVVVQLLYWCCKSNIFLVILHVGPKYIMNVYLGTQQSLYVIIFQHFF